MHTQGNPGDLFILRGPWKAASSQQFMYLQKTNIWLGGVLNINDMHVSILMSLSQTIDYSN